MRLVTIGGIPIRLHWSFAFVVVLVVLAAQGSGPAAIGYAAGWVATLFGSVLVHELGHSLLARRRGFTVRDIVLLPIGGMSEIAELPGAPADEFWIALVGPLTSVGVAALCGAIGALLGTPLWPPTLMSGPFVTRVLWMNLLLAGFNMVPALPLDGGRVFRAALSARRGDLRATELAVTAGRAIGAGMLAFGVLYDLWLAVIGLFVILGAGAEARASTLRRALAGLRVADVMVREFPHAPDPAGPEPLGPDDPLYPTAIEALTRAGADELAVVAEGRQIGVLRRVDVEAVIGHRTRSRL